jgi:hypothetical protein
VTISRPLRDRCGWDDEQIMQAIKNPREPLAIGYGMPVNYVASVPSALAA